MAYNIPGIRDSRERRRLFPTLQYLKTKPRAGVAKPKPRPRGAARMHVLCDGCLYKPHFILISYLSSPVQNEASLSYQEYQMPLAKLKFDVFGSSLSCTQEI